MNIALIGYRGSGKTSVGKCLAQRLSLSFVDTDTLIVQRAGRSIREIFEREGETGFRARESQIIREVAAWDRQVIALGGGAVLNPANIEALKAGGRATVVWLQAAPEILHQRIAADGASSATRPNLTAAGGLEEVRKLLALREPLYQAAADRTCDCTHVTVEDAADHVISLLGRAAPPPNRPNRT
jgi:shikimate kinase